MSSTEKRVCYNHKSKCCLVIFSTVQRRLRVTFYVDLYVNIYKYTKSHLCLFEFFYHSNLPSIEFAMIFFVVFTASLISFTEFSFLNEFFFLSACLLGRLLFVILMYFRMFFLLSLSIIAVNRE